MEDPLVLNEVPSKPVVNPQLNATITSPTERQKLNTSFNSFFEEIDSRPPTAEEPPVAPAPEQKEELQAKEPVPEKTEAPKTPEDPEAKAPEAKAPEVKPAEAKAEPDKKEEAKVDLDSLEPHPAASEENRSHFAKLKNAAKEFRERNKAWEKISPALQELGFSVSDNPEELSKVLGEAVEKIRSLKNGAIAPETMTELESLRSLARSVGVLQSEEFTREYVKPVDTAYVDVVTEMSKYFEGSEEDIKRVFLDPLIEKFKPSQLSPEWWEQQTELMTKASAPVKRKIEQKIANVLLLQEKHDARARELSTSKESYDDWNKKNLENGAKEYAACVRDEVQKIAKEDPVVFSMMPHPLDGVTEPEKIAELKKRNERFPELEREFQLILSDFTSGPRTAARRAIEYLKATEGLSSAKDKLATRDEEVATLNEKFEAEIKALKEDNERLRSEVKTKRQISDVPLKPSAGNGAKATPEKKSLPVDGRKSLQKSFDDWRL